VATRFEIASHPVALGLLAFGTSCQVDGDDGFRVTAVDFDGESTITLTFSEPVGELGDVDPTSFRLSFGTTYRFTYTYEDGTVATEEVTNYFDLGAFIDSGYYDEPLTVTSLSPGSSANRVILQTSGVWGEAACQMVAYLQAEWQGYAEYFTGDAGIFLHYAAGDVPLESASGSALANIGADWVLEGTYSSYEYGFVNLVPQLRIPCE
jgi:hypothetical protein